MKPYFTKYLPVEGEVKEGDITNHGIVKSVEKNKGENPDELKILKEGVRFWYTFTKGGLGTNKNTRKVKLFLCSRDIQVGDTCIDGEGDIVTIIDNKEESKDGFQIRLEDSYPLGCFKVIGEVSPDAIWVTEGMEFEESDLEFWNGVEKHGGFVVDPKIRKDWLDWVNQPVKIKCSNCKTFH